MRVAIAGCLVVVACVALGTTPAGDIKSGKRGGPFDVKAITGDQKGKPPLCYV